VGALAATLLVAADCLAINAVAVAYAPPLSREALGPFAVAYHDASPHPVVFSILAALLALGARLPALARLGLMVFVGASAANVLSPAVWPQGAPDYIVFRDLDLIANVSDVLMVATAVLVAGSVVAELVRRRRASPA
jgi:hypothetical protein